MDDDWDAMGGATDAQDGAPGPVVFTDTDPFESDEAFGGAPAPAAGGGMDMFDGALGEPSSAPAADDLFGGGDPAAATNGDDLFGDAPAPSTGAAPDLDDMFGETAAAAAAAPAAAPPAASPEPAPQEDNRLIEEWERNKRAELEQRRSVSSEKKTAAMQAGKKALEEFDAKRKTDVDKSHAKNRSDEKDTIASIEASLQAGLVGKDSWEKVTSYLDLSSDPKRNNLIARMKSTLIAVKSHPPAEKKNFGA